MKIMEIAPFTFRFKSSSNKKESHNRLINFLKDNQWLNESGDKRLPLTSFHSDESGICHILLENDIISDEYIELTNEMFENLVSDNDVEWIKVGFHPATETVIYNNIDKYFQVQSIPIQEMSKGDLMVVFIRK